MLKPSFSLLTLAIFLSLSYLEFLFTNLQQLLGLGVPVFHQILGLIFFFKLNLVFLREWQCVLTFIDLWVKKISSVRYLYSTCLFLKKKKKKFGQISWPISNSPCATFSNFTSNISVTPLLSYYIS